MFVIIVRESQEVEDDIGTCGMLTFQGLEVDIAIIEWAQPMVEFVIVVLLASLLGEAFFFWARSSTSLGGLPQVVLLDELA